MFSNQGPHEVFNLTLPAAWTMYWDADSGLPYFHNAGAGAALTQWRCPTIDGCATVHNARIEMYLPEGWGVAWDPNREKLYFFMNETRTVSWTPPAAPAAPAPPLEPEPEAAPRGWDAIQKPDGPSKNFEWSIEDGQYRCLACWKLATEAHVSSTSHLAHMVNWKDNAARYVADDDSDEDESATRGAQSASATSLINMFGVRQSVVHDAIKDFREYCAKHGITSMKPCREKSLQDLPELVTLWRKETVNYQRGRHIISMPDDMDHAALQWTAWLSVRNLPVSLKRKPSRHIIFEVSHPEVNADDNRYTYAFHGLRPYALRSVLRRGLTPSTNEGGRHAAHGEGIYTSCRRSVAEYYAVPANVFGDNVIWQVLLRVRVAICNTRIGLRGAFGPENVSQSQEDAVITHVIFKPTLLPTGEGRNTRSSAIWTWTADLEA